MKSNFSFASFIDIMGTLNNLDRFKKIPTEQKAQAAFVKEAEELLKPIELLHSHISQSVPVLHSPNFHDGLTPDLRAIVDGYHVDFDYISDAVLVHGSLYEADGKSPIGAVYQTLRMLSRAMIHVLGSGFPIRGSLCVDVQLPLTNGKFFGPALAQAYNLENTVAKWPRVVVDKSMVDYLDSVAASSAKFGKHSVAISRYASECRKFIIEDPLDSHGWYILDYLGEHHYTSIEPSGREVLRPLVLDMLPFIKRALEEHKGSKLYKYYSNLSTYYYSRQHIWK